MLKQISLLKVDPNFTNTGFRVYDTLGISNNYPHYWSHIDRIGSIHA